MIVHFESRSPCVICGHLNRTLDLSAVIRVNKRSLKVTSQPVLAARLDTPCPECGSKDGTWLNRTKVDLCRDSAAKVDAARAKRWPELSERAMGTRAEAQQREAS